MDAIGESVRLPRYATALTAEGDSTGVFVHGDNSLELVEAHRQRWVRVRPNPPVDYSWWLALGAGPVKIVAVKIHVLATRKPVRRVERLRCG